MKSNKLALTITAIAAGWALSACSHNNAPAASTPVDSAVAAESTLNKSGCSFSNVQLGTTGSETSLQLVCKPTPGADQLTAVTTYIQQIGISSKEPGRKNLSQLNTKLGAAKVEQGVLEDEYNLANAKSMDPSISAHSSTPPTPPTPPAPSFNGGG